MFCHQCQETAKNTGCTMKQGVCGKTAEVANLQDLFIWILRGISFWGVRLNKLDAYDEKAGFFIAKGLFATITNANFSKADFIRYIKDAILLRDSLRQRLSNLPGQNKPTNESGMVPECATWSAESDEAIKNKAESGAGGWLEIKNEDIRSLKAIILYGLKGISAYSEHAYQAGRHSREVFEFLMDALSILADSTMSENALLDMAIATGQFGVKAMALLDAANTSRYGDPVITEVNLGVRSNPGILISGHDFVDLEELLEQTKGSGVDVYTHSEMLPAHYYPKFRRYANLVGNYGNAWWLQKEEIASFNGPVLFTSNCLVPPRPEFTDRIFTTGAVGFEGCRHIPDREPGKAKDFSAIIAKARTCEPPRQLETGKIVGGFAHHQVSMVKEKIVEAVKSGKIKRFVVMGGCDARSKARDYYTQVAKLLPKDAVILTAGCAKYKYLKLDLGSIDGIPRILDAGQCNDSYSLVMTALELQKAFNLTSLHDLPISFDIAWYEQKAVLVLLALLSLGVKGIRLGPTLPGFLSPNIAGILVKMFDIKSIAAPEQDVAAMMEGK